MKTTVKLSATASLVVLPVGEGVRLEVDGPVSLTLDQVGALVFALEQAGAVAESARMLNAAMSKARAAA